MSQFKKCFLINFSVLIDITGSVFVFGCRSEANDLALRLARCHTGAEDAVVLD